MVHDFVKFPELTNSQMDFYYFESPHQQIMQDFEAKVVKVSDGDTIRVRVDFRDFDFPVRFLGTNAPELNEEGGHAARDWLAERILDEEIEILINPKQRVGKWGRLLGMIFHGGININEQSIREGIATTFEGRDEGKIPELNKELGLEKWL